MMISIYEFFSASLLMSIGIGTDVVITTCLCANAIFAHKQIKLWVISVTATHTLFPMAGYLLTYFSISFLPWITPVVGLIASGLIFHYLYTELSPQVENNEITAKINLGLILAISWDALWSGPAKSAQVTHWTEDLIWLSFVVVGAVVLLLTLMSLVLAKKYMYNNKAPAFSLSFAQWLQYSVIAYFGLLALSKYSLGISLSTTLLFSLSAFFIALVQLSQRRNTFIVLTIGFCRRVNILRNNKYMR